MWVGRVCLNTVETARASVMSISWNRKPVSSRSFSKARPLQPHVVVGVHVCRRRGDPMSPLQQQPGDVEPDKAGGSVTRIGAEAGSAINTACHPSKS